MLRVRAGVKLKYAKANQGADATTFEEPRPKSRHRLYSASG